MGSQIGPRKKLMCPQNYFKKKVQIQKITKNKKHKSAPNLWRIIGTKQFAFVNF